MSIPLRLAVHVGDTHRGRTLGVAHYAANMIASLAERDDVEVTVAGDAAVVHGYTFGSTEGFSLESDGAAAELERRTDATVQIHHFLEQPIHRPRVSIVHDLHLFDVAWKYRGATASLERRFAANIESGIVASEFPRTIPALLDRWPQLDGRTHVLPSPTLLSDFDADEADLALVRRRFGIDGGLPTLLFPSQLQAHKNHWNLIAAVARLRDAGRPVRLLLTGSEFRPYLTRGLVQRVDELGLDSLVVFGGYIEGGLLRALYSVVDAVISPSLAEGGAYIAQEAIVHDRPVACSALPSVLAHLDRLGATIPTFDPLDIDAIVSAIAALLDDPARIVSGYGPARAREASWTWDRVAAEVVGLCHRAIELEDPNA